MCLQGDEVEGTACKRLNVLEMMKEFRTRMADTDDEENDNENENAGDAVERNGADSASAKSASSNSNDAKVLSR